MASALAPERSQTEDLRDRVKALICRWAAWTLSAATRRGCCASRSWWSWAAAPSGAAGSPRRPSSGPCTPSHSAIVASASDLSLRLTDCDPSPEGPALDVSLSPPANTALTSMLPDRPVGLAYSALFPSLDSMLLLLVVCLLPFEQVSLSAGCLDEIDLICWSDLKFVF